MLALYLKRYRDELEADFQEYYGLDLDDLGRSFSIRKGSVLAAQLPLSSRCCTAVNPNLSWSNETWLLRRIENLFATFLWSQSKRHGQRPQPIETPAESKRILDSISNTDFEYIAQRLGVTNGD